MDTFELMGSEADAGSRSKGSKRSASRVGTGSRSKGSNRSASRVEIGNDSASSIGGDQETASQVTQKSSWTASRYRLDLLADANIHFQFGSVPKEIHSRIAVIVKSPISKEREEELSRIKKTFHDEFASVLSGAARGDDCVELFHQALCAMNHGDSVLLVRKAGMTPLSSIHTHLLTLSLDWQPSLKPRIRAPMLNLGFLKPPRDEFEESLDREAEESPDRPKKRQHAEESYLSPEASGIAATSDVIPNQDCEPGRMGPLPTPQLEVKTPHPDISVGISDSAVVNALQSKGITGKQAKDFIKTLAIPDAQNGGRPLLCSRPTKQEIHIRFPFLPVEGKAYATGRTIYEAQNQAAVSGACSLEILHNLDDLVRRASANPENHPKLQPIVFSVCTQGPFHELWAHYTTEEDGERNYWQKLWNSCNVALDCENSQFLEDVDNVMKWGVGGHLDNVANQLNMVWTAARQFN